MSRMLSVLAVVEAAVALAACGHNVEQRAATGGIAGAAVAGPVGAVAGAATGAVVGTVTDADKEKDTDKPR